MIANFKKKNDTSGLLLMYSQAIGNLTKTLYSYKTDLTQDQSTVVANDVAKDFQPFVLDLINEDVNGFIYMANNPLRRVYRSLEMDHAVDLSKYLNTSDNVEMLHKLQNLPISQPHFSVFADFNGDCRPDLLLTSFNKTEAKMYLEFWLPMSSSHYKLKKWYEINVEDPSMISQFIIGDFGMNVVMTLQFNLLLFYFYSSCFSQYQQQL